MSMRLRETTSTAATILVVCLVACAGEETSTPAPPAAPAAQPPAAPTPTSTSTPTPTTPTTTTAPPASTDAPFGAISSRGQRVAAPTAPPPTAMGPTIEAPGARFTLPTGWQRENPRSSIRLAQARIDGVDGPGQLTVFHFGPGGGGGAAANLQRWMDQMEPAPGTKPTNGDFSYGVFRVSWVDVAGTLKASTMGMGNAQPQPGSRLLGAVVEGPGGPWFFKAVGPDATVADARDDFFDLTRSAESTS